MGDAFRGSGAIQLRGREDPFADIIAAVLLPEPDIHLASDFGLGWPIAVAQPEVRVSTTQAAGRKSQRTDGYKYRYARGK